MGFILCQRRHKHRKGSFGMKRRILVSGLLVCLLALGLVFVSCGDEGSEEGTFTLTDIPAEYNGKYAVLCADSPDEWGLWGCISSDSNGSSTLPQISNGKVTIPLWQGNQRYSGNDTFKTSPDFRSRIFVKIVGNKVIQTLNEPGDAVFYMSVTFSKGSATKSYKDRLQ